MLTGLEKIKRLIAVHAELPRGLTAKLMEFMVPFAGISTLRRRLGQDRDEGDKAVAVVLAAPAAPAAVVAPVAAPVPAAPAAAAAPKVRRACSGNGCPVMR